MRSPRKTGVGQRRKKEAEFLMKKKSQTKRKKKTGKTKTYKILKIIRYRRIWK